MLSSQQRLCCLAFHWPRLLRVCSREYENLNFQCEVNSPLPNSSQFLDLRVAVLGNVDSGKSTLLGVLTQGELDNGRGRARLNLFRHLHEIQSGRTSSISFEILGFNSKGEVHGISGTQWGQTLRMGW